MHIVHCSIIIDVLVAMHVLFQNENYITKNSHRKHYRVGHSCAYLKKPLRGKPRAIEAHSNTYRDEPIALYMYMYIVLLHYYNLLLLAIFLIETMRDAYKLSA